MGSPQAAPLLQTVAVDYRRIVAQIAVRAINSSTHLKGKKAIDNTTPIDFATKQQTQGNQAPVGVVRDGPVHTGPLTATTLQQSQAPRLAGSSARGEQGQPCSRSIAVQKPTTVKGEKTPRPPRATTAALELEMKLTPSEKKSWQTMLKTWRNRPLSHVKLYTKTWQSVEERMIIFLAIKDEDKREEIFDAVAEVFGWSPQTQPNYWSGLMKAMQLLNMNPSFRARLKAKLLSVQAKESDSIRPTIPASEDQIRMAIKKLTSREAKAALHLAFELGQRQGDVLNLEIGSITVVSKGLQQYIAIRFRKGKTTRRLQPYCLHLRREEQLSNDLLQLQESKQDSKGLLFGNPEQTLEEIRVQMNSLNLSILSIRRGGLQRMSTNGLSIESLLHHSRHTSIPSLMRYLNWGEVSFGAVEELTTCQQTLQLC